MVLGTGVTGEAKTLVVGVHDDLATLDLADFSQSPGDRDGCSGQVYEVRLPTYTPSREIQYELGWRALRPLMYDICSSHSQRSQVSRRHPLTAV